VDLIVRPFDIKKAEREVVVKAEVHLNLVGLRHLRDEYARNLSGGQKKLLELARALMAAPKMVLLDEPVAGVNPTLAQQILRLIEQLRDQGLTFFLIEHDMDVVMKRCDWIIVMHQGRTLVEGVPEEIKTNPRVIESYLGA
jgi:branched-chain amino acid transport system ATP-binding protein